MDYRINTKAEKRIHSFYCDYTDAQNIPKMNGVVVQKNSMPRLLLTYIYQMASEISRRMMTPTELVYKGGEKEPFYKTSEEAGHSQWDGLSLKSTPDIRKKGVTDISKYYT